jgi:hypothetical protein
MCTFCSRQRAEVECARAVHIQMIIQVLTQIDEACTLQQDIVVFTTLQISSRQRDRIRGYRATVDIRSRKEDVTKAKILIMQESLHDVDKAMPSDQHLGIDRRAASVHSSTDSSR